MRLFELAHDNRAAGLHAIEVQLPLRAKGQIRIQIQIQIQTTSRKHSVAAQPMGL